MSNGQYPGNSPQIPPGYPQQQQPQQPQQQPQPQQAPGYPVPPQSTFPAPQQPQPGYPQPQPGYSQQQPQAGQLPSYNMPDESVVAQAYQAHKQEAASWGSGGGDRPQFVKWPGPQGQTKWDNSVPIGYEASIQAYILPPWAPGKNIFRTVKSHFWKSYANPNGKSIGCPGSDTCLICQAREAAMAHPDPAVQERAKSFGRVRTQHLYNVVLLDNPNGHYGQDGQMRPFILGAGAYLHKAIGDIIDDKGGAINVVDPMRGRPVRLKRSKNGPQMMDIQYAALAQDPAPLPAVFYPCLQNIHDLDRQDWQPKYEDMVAAVQEMGVPMPGAPVATGYQTAPVPPGPSPYAYQQAQVGNPSAPTYMPPPADPYEFPPRDAAPASVPAPVMPTVPATNPVMSPGVSPGVSPAVNPGWPPQQAQPMAAPPLAAPPLVSQPGATTYATQPGAGVPVPPPPDAPATATPGAAPAGIPPPPPVTAPPGVQQPVQQSSLSSGTSTSTRPPCFGKYNSQDRTCVECPESLRTVCAAQSGQSQTQQQQPQQALAQLQSQLAGGGQS